MASLTCTALLEIQKMVFVKERRELLEAAEFEQRVAAILAHSVEYRVPCRLGDCDQPKLTCAGCRMKIARMDAEKEMDDEVER